MRAPKVSVVVPCFNYGHVLGETLRSVQEQCLADFECIVVDDGSTDATAQVVRQFSDQDSRFSYVLQPNRGPSAARNTGLRLATGRYIQLLDADDLIRPGKLRVHAQFLDQHAGIPLVYGPVLYFDDLHRSSPSRAPGGRDQAWMRMGPLDGAQFLAALLEDNILPVCAPTFRRELVDQVGLFDEQLASHEDWEFWLRVAFAANGCFGLDDPETTSLVREHAGSLSRMHLTMRATRVALRRRLTTWGLSEPLLRRNLELLHQERFALGIAYLKEGDLRVGMIELLQGFAGSSHKLRLGRKLAVAFGPGWVSRVRRPRFSRAGSDGNSGA